VVLCKHCHELVHRVARKIIHNRAAEAARIVDEAARQREGFDREEFNRLVGYIVEAHYAHAVPHDNPQELRLTLPRYLRSVLKRAARDSGVSVEKFILNAIVAELRKRGWRV